MKQFTLALTLLITGKVISTAPETKAVPKSNQVRIELEDGTSVRLHTIKKYILPLGKTFTFLCDAPKKGGFSNCRLNYVTPL